jgi:hypothetical protein
MKTKFEARYFGDGHDSFSETQWERMLWDLLKMTYAKKSNSDPLFRAPDYLTIVECEDKLESMGIKRTYRINQKQA